MENPASNRCNGGDDADFGDDGIRFFTLVHRLFPHRPRDFLHLYTARDTRHSSYNSVDRDTGGVEHRVTTTTTING